MSNNFEAYCPECKKWWYGWADKKVCQDCGSKLLSHEDIDYQEREHYREVIKSES